MLARSPQNVNLPKGIHRAWNLPDEALGTLWDSIILDAALKSQLLSQAVLNFTLRGKVSRAVVPFHGVILLVGPPGTGKTTLARGLAHRTALSFKGSSFQLLEVEPHALASAAMGKTQRSVSELFSQAISEAATRGPTVVLLDEVETLAADRSKMSLEANPIDIHRATDAVLVQLDVLADEHPQLLFVATSNFPQAVDSAFTSRCDLVMNIPMPDAKGCAAILNDCIAGLGRTFPSVGKLAGSPQLAKVAAACVGLDGRAIRKMVVSAMARDPQTAMNPDGLKVEQLLAAAQDSTASRAHGDKKP